MADTPATYTREQIAAMTAEEYAKNRDQIMTQLASGHPLQHTTANAEKQQPATGQNRKA